MPSKLTVALLLAVTEVMNTNAPVLGVDQVGAPPAEEVKICPDVPAVAGAITVPLVLGNVRTVDPAVAGACSVTEPEVSPAMTTELIIFP